VFDGFLQSLNEIPLAGMMLVIVSGYLLGRLEWRGVSLGPAGGTLLLALIGGHFGLSLDAVYGERLPELSVGLFGFALFIYAVGFEAGPRLLSRSQGRRGWRFVATGVLVNGFAIAMAWGLARVFAIDASTMAGVLAGALTSAPTYAAVSEIVPDRTLLAVSFALTYPIGLLGLVLAIQVWPALRADRLRRAGQGVPSSPLERLEPQHGSPEISRTFRVDSEELAGASLGELALGERTGCIVTRVRRGERIFFPTTSSRLEVGDRVRVTGRVDELQGFEALVGREIHDPRLAQHPPSWRVQITRRDAIGKTLAELDLTGRYQVLVGRIESGPVLLEPSAEAVLHRSDVVELLGEARRVEAAVRELGRLEPSSAQTDIAMYAGGIFLGVVLGSLHWEVSGFDFSLGLAGGLLLAGVLLGRCRQIGPFSAAVPLSARQLVRDLGILLFVSETGIQAGRNLAEAAGIDLALALGSAAAIVVVSLVLSVLVARTVFRLDALESLGSVCGGMTSSAALNVLQRSAESSEPAVSYAAAYAVASVLVTMSGHVLVALI